MAATRRTHVTTMSPTLIYQSRFSIDQPLITSQITCWLQPGGQRLLNTPQISSWQTPESWGTFTWPFGVIHLEFMWIFSLFDCFKHVCCLKHVTSLVALNFMRKTHCNLQLKESKKYKKTCIRHLPSVDVAHTRPENGLISTAKLNDWDGLAYCREAPCLWKMLITVVTPPSAVAVICSFAYNGGLHGLQQEDFRIQIKRLNFRLPLAEERICVVSLKRPCLGNIVCRAWQA